MSIPYEERCHDFLDYQNNVNDSLFLLFEKAC